jgi:hypothetical protein
MTVKHVATASRPAPAKPDSSYGLGKISNLSLDAALAAAL